MKMKSMCLWLLGVSVNGSLFAANVTQVDRYITVDNKPSAAQINPLMTVMQVHFPHDVVTVGQAVRHWVAYSGYRLVDEDKMDKALKEILSQKLPQADRNLGPLTVQDGLKVLVGQDVFDLICDPLHRLVSFKLKKKYQLALAKTRGGKA